MYLDESFPSQVDLKIVLRKRRVVKYRLLKKGSANDRPNYTLELRIIHVQKLIPAAACRSTSEKQSARIFKVNLAYHRHDLLARFSTVVLRLALLSWPMICYSLRMSNADWVDPIFQTNEDRCQRKLCLDAGVPIEFNIV